MQEQIQEEDDVTKDVISQYLPTRKRKPRAKKPAAVASTSGNGELTQWNILSVSPKRSGEIVALFRSGRMVFGRAQVYNKYCASVFFVCLSHSAEGASECGDTLSFRRSNSIDFT